MLVMGLDTSLQNCSVAILRDGAVIAEQSMAMERGHAERLAPMTATALAEAGLRVRDLDRIGVVVGPGGFTGIRVGLSFARGLAIGTGLETVAVNSLAALAENLDSAAPETLIAPVIDARRGQLYAALYQGGGIERLAPFVATPEEVSAQLEKIAGEQPVLLVVGSGAPQIARYKQDWMVADASTQINAKHVARLAAAAPSPDGPPRPLYLRAPDAKPPKPGPFQGVPRNDRVVDLACRSRR